MKRILLPLAICIAIALPCHADLRATWSATPSEKEAGSVHLNINQEPGSNFGRSYALSDLAGLTSAQINSASTVPVQFTLTRDAGTLAFEGTFKAGLGAGRVTFTPNRDFPGQLRSLGLTLDLHDRGRKQSEDQNLFDLAVLDVSAAFIRSMQAVGYDHEPLERYLEMRIFRITPEVVQQFRTAGFPKLSAEDLIATGVHRLTPEYIAEMRAAGYPNLSMDDLMASRVHRLTPEFIREMQSAGYPNLSFEDLMAFRIHRVTPEVIRQYRDLGYEHLSPEDLVAMSIHRVTPQFIRELEDAGYEHVPVEKLLEMKIRRIRPEGLKRMDRD